jgi:hypothetical protein
MAMKKLAVVAIAGATALLAMAPDAMARQGRGAAFAAGAAVGVVGGAAIAGAAYGSPGYGYPAYGYGYGYPGNGYVYGYQCYDDPYCYPTTTIYPRNFRPYYFAPRPVYYVTPSPVYAIPYYRGGSDIALERFYNRK